MKPENEIQADLLVVLEHLNHQRYDQGLALLNEQFAAILEHPDHATNPMLLAHHGYAYQMLGYHHVLRRRLNEAITEYEKCASIAEALANNQMLASALGGIGNACLVLGDIPKALDYASRALELYEKIGYEIGIASECGNLGNIHHTLGDFARAREYAERSVRMYEQLEQLHDCSTAYANLSYALQELGELDEAEACLMKGLAIAEQIGNTSTMARLEGNLGTLMYYMKKPMQAMEHMQSSLRLQEQIGNPAGVALMKSNIGWMHGQRDLPIFDPQRAEQFVLEAIVINEQLGVKAGLVNNYESLSQVLEAAGRFEDSLTAFKKHHQLLLELQSQKARDLAEKQDAAFKLGIERARAQATEQVLHRVLPSSIADRLTRGEEVADHFEKVSIFFSDIVGFTPMASRMSAHDVIGLLNFIFEAFDRIMAKHGCEKIKTIGDGYMAVSGAPIACTDHAERLARASLEILREVRLSDEIAATLPAGSSFQIRIGLHCGQAFAGIVGINRFVYDVYSDTVNTAARMESHGKPGQIHCSEDFALELQSHSDAFEWTETFDTDVKGKGMMRTCFLVGEKSQ